MLMIDFLLVWFRDVQDRLSVNRELRNDPAFTAGPAYDFPAENDRAGASRFKNAESDLALRHT
jgi:hypothetical protein